MGTILFQPFLFFMWFNASDQASYNVTNSLSILQRSIYSFLISINLSLKTGNSHFVVEQFALFTNLGFYCFRLSIRLLKIRQRQLNTQLKMWINKWMFVRSDLPESSSGNTCEMVGAFMIFVMIFVPNQLHELLMLPNSFIKI